MIARYRDGSVPDVDTDPALRPDFDGLVDEVCALLDRAEVTQALDRIWQRVRRLNRYVEERAPWQLAKDDAKQDELDVTLRSLAEGIRAVTVLLHPYIPETAAKLLEALGEEELSLDTAGVRRPPRRRHRRHAARAALPEAAVIDSHTHLDSTPGTDAEIVAAARAAGVTRILTIGTDARELRAARRTPRRRTTTSGSPSATTRTARRATRTRSPTSCARSPATRAARRSARPGSTTTATTRRAPTRSARSPRTSASPASSASRSSSTRAPPTTTRSPRWRATRRASTVILHCFSMPDRLDECLDHGWWISFAGNVTYPKARELAFAAERAPLDRLLVETDAPYLTPQAVRKERNQPAYVVHTARFVAERRGIALRRARRRRAREQRAPVRLVSELPVQPSLRRMKAFGIRPKRDLGPELPDRLEHPRRHRARRRARPRGRRARGRRRARRAERAPGRARRPRPRGRARPHARAGAARRARPAPQRDAPLRRRGRSSTSPRSTRAPTKVVANLPYGVAATRHPAHRRGAAARHRLGRDGAEGGGGAVRGEAGYLGLRRALACSRSSPATSASCAPSPVPSSTPCRTSTPSSSA